MLEAFLLRYHINRKTTVQGHERTTPAVNATRSHSELNPIAFRKNRRHPGLLCDATNRYSFVISYLPFGSIFTIAFRN
jgi:hypothetical protein